MGFLNIVIILRILLGFFQVFYAIFRDFLGFFQRFFEIFKKIFRVIYPSLFHGHDHGSNLVELYQKVFFSSQSVIVPYLPMM